MEEIQPPRIKPSLRSAPRIRQVYWCDFPRDAQLPEFWKIRPVLIISKTAKLNGNVTVLPFSTKSQSDNPAAVPVKSPIDNQQSWIICNYIATVVVSRLRQDNKGIARLSEADFNKAITIMIQYLPRPNP